MTTAKTRNRLPEAIVITVLFLLPCLFFWQLLAPNPADRATIPAGDFTEQYYPLHLFAAREWAQGRLPLWDPYIYAGQPALADIQSGALYPLNLLVILLLALAGRGFPLWARTNFALLCFQSTATLSGVGFLSLVQQMSPYGGEDLFGGGLFRWLPVVLRAHVLGGTKIDQSHTFHYNEQRGTSRIEFKLTMT